MFAENVVGSANGVSAGWGNLGGGVTTAWMPLVLVEPAKEGGCSPELAWRLSMLFPAGMLLLCAVSVKLLCWDTPVARRFVAAHLGKSKPVSICDYVRVLRDPRVWVLTFQYSACFGTELVMYSQLPRHFSTYFQMTASKAAAMASLFGLTNLASRPFGGILSDVVNRRFGLQGRIWLQFTILMLEAAFLLGFGYIDSEQPLSRAAIVLFCFSVFCEMGCGTTYGIVPFMNRQEMSSVSALVGAGGNLGAVIAGQAFYKPIPDDLIPYRVHGGYVFAAALLTPVLFLKGAPQPLQTPPASESEAVKVQESTVCDARVSDEVKETTV